MKNNSNLRLEALLMQYSVLRDELLQKFANHIKLYSFFVTAIPLSFGYILNQKVYDLLLAIPLFSIALSFRYLWEQNVIVMIGNYIQHMESDLFPSVIGYKNDISKTEKEYWIGWEHFFQKNFPAKKYYKPAVLFLFVIIPIAPSITFSSLVLLNNCHILSLSIKSVFPLWLHLIAIVSYLSVAGYLQYEFWKT